MLNAEGFVRLVGRFVPWIERPPWCGGKKSRYQADVEICDRLAAGAFADLNRMKEGDTDYAEAGSR